MRPIDSYFRSAWFHVLAFIALVTFVTTGYFTALAENETRVHAFHCTFIFHIGGQIVVRTPDDQLHFCNLFSQIDPDFIFGLCGMCGVVWLAVTLLRILDRLRKKDLRGFKVILEHPRK